MNASLSLILIVVGSYLAAHVAFGWLARRYQIVSGAEYLLLGILLGPEVSGLISASVLGGFAPFLTLALGWIGVVVGAQFRLPELIRVPATHFRIALAEWALTFAVVTVVMGGVLRWRLDLSFWEAVLPAVALGTVGAVTAPTGIALVARRLTRRTALIRQLQISVGVGAVLSIVAFGLLLAVVHPDPPGAVRPLTPTEWAVVAVGIGVVGGVLFHLFLDDERKIDRIFISLLGAVILASGAAAYARLSPLLPSMLIGMILVNTSGGWVEIRQVLSTVERPLYFVLLVFAGAAWQPSTRAWLIPVAAFLVTRGLAKLTGAAVGTWLNGAGPALGYGWGRALLGHGGLAVAIALNYQIQERSLLANIVFTAAVVSVLLTDLTSARVAEAAVRSMQRQDASPASPSLITAGDA